tara:strand:- start:1169 stop:1546 length:378 start_codon:yes stop_codon:yes gene_type:complete
MSNKSENISFVHSFLNDREIFFEAVFDLATFNKDSFHKYTQAIYELSKENLSLEERYEIAIIVWEVSLKIEDYIGQHCNPNDPFSFENLTEDDPRQISNIIYYSANWFSYQKEMESESLIIGNWA